MAVDNKAVLELVAQAKGAIAEIDKLRKEFVGDAKKMSEAADKVAFDKSLASAGKLKSGLGNLKGLLIGLGAAAAAIGLKGIIEGSVGALIRQEDAIAQVEARLRSTKGAAGLTSDELQKLAASMQDVTKFGDEAVLEAEALLLTFTKIGKTVFPDATEATLNMAQAMGTDLKSAALQVGKALNDPVLGVTALSRAGVQFTKGQKDVIKSLVDTGQAAKAQQIILAELETQLGGAARAARETLGGSLQSLKNIVGDLQESFASGFATELKGSIDQASESIEANKQLAEDAGRTLGTLGTAVGKVLGLFNEARAVVAAVQSGFLTLTSLIVKGLDLITKPIQALVELVSKLPGLGFLGEGLDSVRGAIKGAAEELDLLAESFREVALEQWNADAERAADATKKLGEGLKATGVVAPPAGEALAKAGEQVAKAGDDAAKAEKQLRDLRLELQGGSDKTKELASQQADLSEEIEGLQNNTERTREESDRLFDAQSELFEVTADLSRETEKYSAQLLNLNQSQQDTTIDAALLVEQLAASGVALDETGEGALRNSALFGELNDNVRKLSEQGRTLTVTMEGQELQLDDVATSTQRVSDANLDAIEGLRDRQDQIPAFVSALKDQARAEEESAATTITAKQSQAESLLEINALLNAQIGLFKALRDESGVTAVKLIKDFEAITAAAEKANRAIAA